MNFRKNPKIARSYYHPIFYATCSVCHGIAYLLLAISLKVKYISFGEIIYLNTKGRERAKCTFETPASLRKK